jgi:DNA-binding transcriptional MerR regulator
VLRYWETEFRAVRPQKSRSQQRVYRRKDVETLLRIKHLLYERKFTIAGARIELEESKAKSRESDEPIERAAPNPAYLARQSLAELRSQLDALAKLLRSDDDATGLAADPATFVRENGGALAIMAGNAEQLGSAQPLLDRPERGDSASGREAHSSPGN